jgi:hypothetical protein
MLLPKASNPKTESYKPRTLVRFFRNNCHICLYPLHIVLDIKKAKREKTMKRRVWMILLVGLVFVMQGCDKQEVIGEADDLEDMIALMDSYMERLEAASPVPAQQLPTSLDEGPTHRNN